MTLLIWLLPPLASLALSYYFNNKKATIHNRFFWTTTALDALVSTTLLYVILIRLVVDSGIVTILFVILFLVFALIRFLDGDIGGHNVDIEVETIKNTLIIIGTTLLPFIYLWYQLRNQPPVLQVFIAIGTTAALFALSLLLKKQIKRFVDYVQIQSQMMHDLTITVTIYISASIGIITLVVLTILTIYSRPNYEISYDFMFLPDVVDQTNLLQWEDNTIIDIDTSRVDRTVLLLTENKQDYLVVFLFNVEDESIAEVYNLPHNDSSTLTQNPYVPRFGQGYIDFVIPSEGLYIYTDDDISIVPDSANLPVQFVSLEFCANCFIVDNQDNTYSVLNNVFQITDTIELSDNTDELVVIDGFLFQKTPDTYRLYEDVAIAFTIFDGTPTYDSERQTMYTINPNDGSVTLTKEELNQPEITETFPLEEGYVALPLFEDSYFFNPIELFQSKHKTTFDRGLDVLSYRQSDETYLSILRYDPKKYAVSPNEDRTRASVMEISTNNSTLVFQQASLDLDVAIDTTVINQIRIQYLIVAVILFFIPITSYQKHITTIDFKSQI